jgi:hypothetical protein
MNNDQGHPAEDFSNDQASVTAAPEPAESNSTEGNTNTRERKVDYHIVYWDGENNIQTNEIKAKKDLATTVNNLGLDNIVGVYYGRPIDLTPTTTIAIGN